MADNNSGGKSKKQGRDKVRCNAYRLSMQGEINQARRLSHYLKKFPQDAGGAFDTFAKLMATPLPNRFRDEFKARCNYARLVLEH